MVREDSNDWATLTKALAGIAEVDPQAGRAYFSPGSLRSLAGGREWAGPDASTSAPVTWDLQVKIEPDDFRHVLGHFPTGVAVLTADRPEGPVGMACNSLTSVSLEPPLVAVCPAKTSETWPEIRMAGRFLINLIPRQQETTVLAFARKGLDRFAAVSFHPRRCGPALDDALAWIECVIEAEHEAGDHTIVLARVAALEAREDVEPLVFFRGRYGTFAGADA